MLVNIVTRMGSRHCLSHWRVESAIPGHTTYKQKVFKTYIVSKFLFLNILYVEQTGEKYKGYTI